MQIQLQEMIFGAIQQVWYLFPLLILIAVFKSRWFKGLFGEFVVNQLLSQLPQEDYVTIKDVTLPTEHGTTQIDHIVISIYGIFIIETKNMKGWIFGSFKQRRWTQRIYRHSSTFQNPLLQNYKHLQALAFTLGIPTEKLHSIIVFVGDSQFKTPMPDNVTHTRGCVRYIERFRTPEFTHAQVSNFINLIETRKLERGLATNMVHRKHVKSIIRAKSSSED